GTYHRRIVRPDDQTVGLPGARGRRVHRPLPPLLPAQHHAVLALRLAPPGRVVSTDRDQAVTVRYLTAAPPRGGGGWQSPARLVPGSACRVSGVVRTTSAGHARSRSAAPVARGHRPPWRRSWTSGTP